MQQPVENTRRGRRTSGRRLLQLVFASAATRCLSEDDLAAIAESSRRHNAAASLTGLLLYQGGAFHAVLEGPEPDLLRRMEVIIIDPRHRELRIVLEKRIESRRFSNWTFSNLANLSPSFMAAPSHSEFLQILTQRLR